jgi:hypothetical protein
MAKFPIGVFEMRKAVIILFILTIGFSISIPAIGFTFTSEVHQPYSIKSGSQANYSFGTGIPAHKLRPEMVMMNKYPSKALTGQTSRIFYSFKTGAVPPYSIKLLGATNAIPLGMKAKKEAALLGSINKQQEATAEAIPVSEAEVPLFPFFLSLSSKPQEANISIDENSTGLYTPDTIYFKEPGYHTYNLTKTGFYPYEKKTYVEYTTEPRIYLDEIKK